MTASDVFSPMNDLTAKKLPLEKKNYSDEK